MPIWTLAPDADLRWRIWGEEFLVFHPPSGDTHILNPLAAEALRRLTGTVADVDTLTTHVADLFQLQADGELHRQMEQCIAQFAELGLIVTGEPSHADTRTA